MRPLLFQEPDPILASRFVSPGNARVELLATGLLSPVLFLQRCQRTFATGNDGSAFDGQLLALYLDLRRGVARRRARTDLRFRLVQRQLTRITPRRGRSELRCNVARSG